MNSYVDAFKDLTPDEQAEINAIAARLEKQPEEEVISFPFTDLGNAERFVHQHKENIRYCALHEAWFIWDGKRWKRDPGIDVYFLARQTVRSIPKEAEQFEDGDRRAQVLKWAAKSESWSKIRDMVKLAQSDPTVTIEPEEFDRNPWLLNCLNGTLNLKTGTLQPHRREDLITQICPVNYDSAATCHRWKQFVSEIFCGNTALMDYIQKVCGYFLTGSTKEQDFYIFYGTGANGKSTFLKIMMELMGPDYAKQTEANALLVKRHQTIGEEIAALTGARLITTIEVEDGKRLAEALVKQLTGGDRVRTRTLYKSSFEFDPTFKLVMACNHKPRIAGTDDGIWRRIKLIPFTVHIPEHKQDPDLADKLKQELPGILNWALTGCLKWQKEGLIPPEEVDAATAVYRVESDLIGAFLEECTITDNQQAKTQVNDLYECYKSWIEAAGEHPLSMRKFGDRLRDRGFVCVASTGNRKYWLGIGLTAQDSWTSLGREIDTP